MNGRKKLNFGRANDVSLIKHDAILEKYDLALVYIDFVSFNKNSWDCYLRGTWEFFPALAWLQIHVMYTFFNKKPISKKLSLAF